ncbi:hypothetical protein P4H61_14285 [Paenibacillus peoriae]|uniref:hypothetical protein n=1 Tax=Paenibacillus peoriae TaxID=59893 RepID=UPI00026C6644|nr:hypothetical protein [Paenibacillus peoriae]MEC0182648.1 hypothetical protein [Paenibacillus peoriae]
MNPAAAGDETLMSYAGTTVGIVSVTTEFGAPKANVVVKNKVDTVPVGALPGASYTFTVMGTSGAVVVLLIRSTTELEMKVPFGFRFSTAPNEKIAIFFTPFLILIYEERIVLECANGRGFRYK